jgi:hypothetical protein
VPEGTARLRISLTLNVSDAQTDAMIALLAQELAALPSSARPEETGVL